jgi:DNA adenine methylase
MAKKYSTAISFEEFFKTEAFQKGHSLESRTILIYYGGKSRDADWIIRYFPPHKTYIDVFGGGGAVTFRKRPSIVDIYNDIGNVANFFAVLRDNPDELYRKLYLTPFSRKEFDDAVVTWEDEMKEGNLVEWARKWYIVINQGYTHEEDSNTWHVAKQVNSARALVNHTDDIPAIVNRLRRIHIEHLSFEKLIPLYDLEDGSSLFYCDPPYVEATRADVGNYRNEMPIEKHIELLNMLQVIKGQAVVSGYASELYDSYLTENMGWKRYSITHKSAIQNSKSVQNRGDRTEVLWKKEHHGGLWD